MNLEAVSRTLLYCTLMNGLLLAAWSLLVVFCREWVHRLASRHFQLSRQQLEAIHVVGILFYKIGFLLLNLAPYLAVRFVMYQGL